MIESDIQRWAEFVGPWLLAWAGIGLVVGLVIAAERWLRSSVDTPELTESIKAKIDESELTEMVNAEMAEWGYLLYELDLGEALPQWVIDDLQKRMLYVASAAMHGRKSKVESEA